MSPHEPKPGPPTARPENQQARLGIGFSQLAASALAAGAAAFGASFLGVAGTIIGASVASVIATVVGAMYTSSVHRTRTAVQSTVAQWTRTAATAPVVDPDAPQAPGSVVRRLPWARLSLAAVAVLAITLGTLTGVEGLLGRPIATVVGGSDSTGTSLGSVGRSGTSSPKQRDAVTEQPAAPASTPSPTPAAMPTTAPTAAPTADTTPTPTATPTPGPTDGPIAAPTATPTG